MTKLRNDIQTCCAFAPATCSNVAVGFDILGFAVAGIGDQVTLTRRADDKITLRTITGVDMQQLPEHPSGNTATAVAAMVALNGFLEKPLDKLMLAQYAIFGESVASGSAHADNVAPCLFGGFTLTWKSQPLQVLPLPIPPVFVVLVHPAIRLDTRQARAHLPKKFDLPNIVNQTGHLALLISALHQQDMNLLSESLEDVLIEPYRANLVPNFHAVKEAALEANCLASMRDTEGDF